MSILMYMEAPGMTVEQYDRAMASMGVSDDPPEGLVEHWAGSDGEGIVAVDLWDSAEAFGRFAETRLRPALEEVGVEAAGPPRILPLHNSLYGKGRDANVLLLIEMSDFTPDGYDELTAKTPAHEGDGSNHPSLWHAAAKTDDGGLFVADVWDSPEEFGKFAEEQLAGDDSLGPLEPRFVPVHNRIRGRAAQNA